MVRTSRFPVCDSRVSADERNMLSLLSLHNAIAVDIVSAHSGVWPPTMPTGLTSVILDSETDGLAVSFVETKKGMYSRS